MTAPPNYVQRIVDAVDYFRRIAAAQHEHPDAERLIDGYLDLRGELARAFQGLASSMLVLDTSALDGVISEVNDALTARYADAVDDSRLTAVRGYGGIRRVLFAYLLLHHNQAVGASRLRVLTGDQVHTERRVRELRDLGLSIPSQRVGGEDSYRLDMNHFNPVVGARNIIRRNLRDAAIPTSRREFLHALVERIDASEA